MVTRSPAKKTTPPSKAAKRPATKVRTPPKPALPAPVPEAKVKHKLVRDSFTIPKNEYATLSELKQRAIHLAHPVKKSELLRAGVRALSGMSDEALLAALRAVPSLKTGRPKDDGKSS